MTDPKTKSIGVFDSGIGGLTVIRALMERLPHENLVYFGDTARVPYGTKSEDVIKQYAVQDAEILIEKGVKLIVVACNTVSSVALDLLEQRFDVPIIGMIHPGATHALDATRNNTIGVIGTVATIGSNAYPRSIYELRKNVNVYSAPCPLFVSLAEEGWSDHPASKLIAQEYLTPLIRYGVDTLILGCTHYPILKNVIQQVMGEEVALIDSGEAAADEVIELLTEEDLLNPSTMAPRREFMVSDVPQKFKQLGDIFLGKTLERVTRVQI
ncbi:MAG: glutamate racemase [Ectothiorhodospiraceae bacterium]|nr:glutamate racemase [Ectothiorhodospiraceae bacterium]